MKPTNLLFIMSDEHNPKMLGCAGHPLVRTPNLDRLADGGTRFTAAYTNCPICVPARASFATGRYVHEIGYWDNAMGYDGRVPGWGHRLQDAGHRVESIGKLHYRNETDPTGFDAQTLPMHVVEGMGQIWGSVRDPLPPPNPERKMLKAIGPGESNYNRYDRDIADAACDWLKDAAARADDTPWVLYVGFVAPHFPLVVPEEFFDLYPLDEMPPAKLHPKDGHARHPWIEAMDEFQRVEKDFTDETRAMATAAYFGLCTFIDAQIGRVLDALAESGLADTTRVVYTSDHGDNVGARGLWGKSNFYEESVGIPMILSGPDVPAGETRATPVTLVDGYQTILDAIGLELTEEDAALPGRSLFELAAASDDPDRVAFSEYHAVASPTGGFMVRKGRYKLNYYAGMRPELYDLAADPEETRDLADDPAHARVLAEYQAVLRAITDPEETDRRAKADQAALVERHGGREAAMGLGPLGATPVPGQGSE